jgi:hypothetical protein
MWGSNTNITRRLLFLEGRRRFWKKKKWMKLLVIWLTIVRFMCVWKDRVCSSSMINLVLWNQCLLPLMLRVRIPRCTTLCDKVCQVGGVLHVLRFPPPIKLTVTIYIYFFSFLIILLNFYSKVFTKANISLPGGQYMFINR